MTLDKEIDKAELVKIIRSLIVFIVRDGKGFVNEEQMEAYVKQYLLTLSKSMNGINDFVSMNSIWAIVKNDLSNSNLNSKTSLD